MCKHISSTVVKSWLQKDEALPSFLWGVEVHLHQCDMCGLTLPERPVVADEGEDLPLIDMAAMSVGVQRALNAANQAMRGGA